MSATIKDIARLTNLSLGTISNYLNGQKIREKNRVLIEGAIDELNYSVNEFGRNLKTNRSASIGIIMPYLDDPYAAKIASNAARLLRQNNYAVLVSDTDGVQGEKSAIKFMMRKRVEGVISFPVFNTGNPFKLLDDAGVPYVFIDRVPDGTAADSVVLNNIEVSQRAVEGAIEKGHRKIGILTGTVGAISADERFAGYREALRCAGLIYDEKYVKRGVYNIRDEAIRLARELLDMPDPPTVIFATNYFFTLGVIVVCNELKLKIGEDISLIGFDNILITEFIRPKLTMVCQPMEKFAEEAVRILLGRISGEYTEERRTHVCGGYILNGDTVKDLNDDKERKNMRGKK